MGTVLLYLLLVLLFVAVFIRPWVTVIAYYTFALLAPQHIWFWIFGDLPISKTLTIYILLSILVTTLKGKINFNRLLHPQNYLIAALWGIIHISNLLAPIDETIVVVPVSLVLSTLNSLMIVYFSAQLLITSKAQFMWIYYSTLSVGIYYTYWSNRLYLTGEMWIYSMNGRLGGPINSNYSDENSFALIFVVTMPFIIALSLSKKTLFKKIIFSLPVPLLWHSVFLTGSRGGLLALVAALYFSFRHVKSVGLKALMVAAISAALLFQGGNVLTRSQNTIASAEQTDEEPIDPRIKSWTAGLEMMLDYPLLGVGTERFLSAYPSYQEGKIHTTHNTFFQIAANNGVFAGMIYLLLLYHAFNVHRLVNSSTASDKYKLMNDASLAAYVGFFITSMFLDLMAVEIFYVLLFINIVKYHLLKEATDNEPIIK